MGCSPLWSSPMWVFSMGCSPSRAALTWVPSTAYSSSGTDSSSLGPLWGHKSCQKICSYVESSPQAPFPARTLLLHAVSMGCSLIQGISTCSDVGFFTTLSVDIYSTMVFPCAAQCLSTSSLSFTDLGVCRAIFPTLCSFLSQTPHSLFYLS